MSNEENNTANVTVESDGMNVSISISGPNAVEECERLLDKVLEWLDDDDDDDDEDDDS